MRLKPLSTHCSVNIMAKHSKPEPVHNCADCDTPLERIFDDTGTQYSNALEIELHGGYGMFFDNIDGDRLAFLCHDCAHEACERNPWLGALINPARSHSHREEYWAANPDHEGWDKE